LRNGAQYENAAQTDQYFIFQEGSPIRSNIISLPSWFNQAQKKPDARTSGSLHTK